MSSPISGISNAPTVGSNPPVKTSNDNLGKDAFLKLLIAQLRNQDPMKPQEDKEFIAQLAQFSSLESLQAVQQRMDSLVLTQGLGEAAALIGKNVTAGLTDGSKVTGTVTQVRVVSGVPRLIVNDKEVELSQVQSVQNS